MTATKKAKTARSTSTRSIPQAKIDLLKEIGSLHDELEMREAIIRDIDASNAALKKRNEEVHSTAQDLLRRQEESLRRAEAAEAVIRMRDRRAREMFIRIFDLEIRAARLEGYIDCADKRAVVSAVNSPAPGDLVDFGRDSVLMAGSESQRDRIIESMDQETLDAVLGRTGNEQSDILR